MAVHDMQEKALFKLSFLEWLFKTQKMLGQVFCLTKCNPIMKIEIDI